MRTEGAMSGLGKNGRSRGRDGETKAAGKEVGEKKIFVIKICKLSIELQLENKRLFSPIAQASTRLLLRLMGISVP